MREETSNDAAPEILISVLVPAYNRAQYLRPLLESVLAQSVAPFEVVICEDMSPERSAIAECVRCMASKFHEGPLLRYVENVQNLGYDGNLRRLVELARGTHVMFLGNDDELAPTAVEMVKAEILAARPFFISRALAQKGGHTLTTGPKIGFARGRSISGEPISDVGLLFGLASVLSGLVFERAACLAAATDRFDGGLYYQYHLALKCNAAGGTSYLDQIVVLCRPDLSPDFGRAASETQFTPGRYTARARARMAQGAIAIACAHGVPTSWKRDIAREMNVHQSIHIFEMLSSSDRGESIKLFRYFLSMGLFIHPVPILLLLFNVVCGRRGRPYFLAIKAGVKKCVIAVGIRGVTRAEAV